MKTRRVLALAALAVWGAGVLRADVRLHGLFQDHMVLQREKPLRVFGWADPGETVKVVFNGASGTCQAGADGAWRVELPPAKAGGPHELTVTGANTLTLHDVLAGDVWIGAGQSNMGWTLGRMMAEKAGEAVAENDSLRLFVRFSQGSLSPRSDVEGRWVVARPGTEVQSFSGVGYYFGSALQKELGVPVGIYQAGYGGSHILQWIPETDLQAVWSQPMNGRDPEGPTQGAAYAAWAATNLTPEVRQVYEAAQRMEAREQAFAFAKGWKSRYVPAADDPTREQMAILPRLEYSLGRYKTLYPCVAYNGVMHPITRFPVKGVIWYQGEYNAGVFGMGNPAHYARYLAALTGLYRRLWQDPELPFLIVQLQADIGPQIRDEQLRAYLDGAVSGMVVTADLPGGIHPPAVGNKDIVGARLAKLALARVYGRTCVYSGPIVASAERQGTDIVVRFEHVGGGLVCTNGPALREFQVKGGDRKAQWVDAPARIAGDTVVVDVAQAGEPVELAYGFNKTPACDLRNAAGLPASPFLVPVPFARGKAPTGRLETQDGLAPAPADAHLGRAGERRRAAALHHAPVEAHGHARVVVAPRAG